MATLSRNPSGTPVSGRTEPVAAGSTPVSGREGGRSGPVPLMNLPPDVLADETSRGRVLVIDDEPDIRESLEALLSQEGYQVGLAGNAAEGLKRLETGLYDLVLLDLMMPDKSGMQVLEEIRARDQDTPIFMITAYGSIEVAIDALKRGASDYFSKPWDNQKLLIEIDRMIASRRLERENTELKRALRQRYSFPNIVGKSERMLKILDLVGQVALSRATILITGETGTGKELIARAIHSASKRSVDLKCRNARSCRSHKRCWFI